MSGVKRACSDEEGEGGDGEVSITAVDPAAMTWGDDSGFSMSLSERVKRRRRNVSYLETGEDGQTEAGRRDDVKDREDVYRPPAPRGGGAGRRSAGRARVIESDDEDGGGGSDGGREAAAAAVDGKSRGAGVTHDWPVVES